MSCPLLSVNVSGSDFDPLLSAYYNRSMQLDVDYSTSVIHGGITNLLYLIDTTEDTKLILRIYGAKTDEMIDRAAEIALIRSLDGLKFKGCGFHALFENGRIEKHIAGRALEPAEMTLPRIVPQIARSIARLHAVGHQVDSATQALFSDRDVLATTKKFLAMACLVSFPEDHAQKKNILASIQVEDLRGEIDWLMNRIQNLAIINGSDEDQNNDDLLSQKETGYKFTLGNVLVHGDLLSGNILLDNVIDSSTTESAGDCIEDGISLIDFEYATYSARGYDIGNHFCECCGFDFNLDSFPDEVQREAFLAVYLKEYFSNVDSELAVRYNEELASDASSPSLKHFHRSVDEVIMHFTMLCSLFWSTWSLSLAGSKPDAEFDYLGYAKIRRDSYFYFKEKVTNHYE